MGSSHIIGVLFALTSALLYGSGDFSGGFASRRNHQFQVLTLSSLASVVFIGMFLIMRGEYLLSLGSSLWATLAGVSGTLGLAALYRALSFGNTAIVAPTAGVVGAAFPVLLSACLEGFPNLAQLTGFIAAIFGIWFVTRSPSAIDANSHAGLPLAFLAGISFGGYFILIAQVHSDEILSAILVQKIVAVCVALLFLLWKRMPVPAFQNNPVALLAGVLDSGANAFYLLAKQSTRLDVAVVLSSLYPAATVLLARFLFKEHIARVQWIGVVLCLTAIALIAFFS